VSHPPRALAPGAAYVMLTVVMLLWASGVIVARSVADAVHPIGFSFWRWVVAVLALAPLAVRGVAREFAFIREHIARFVLLGTFMAGGSTLLVWSVQYTTATNVALISAAQPTVTAIVAWLVLRERLHPRQIAGVLAAAAGILGMVVRMDIAVLANLALNPGDLLIALSIMFYALYAVNLHPWVGHLPPFVIMYLTAVSGLIVIAPFYVVELVWVGDFALSLPVAGATAYMALVPTIIATTMWNTSVGVVGVNRASSFINLLPVFGTALAIALLGETLHSFHLIGGLLVCAGITLVVRRS